MFRLTDVTLTFSGRPVLDALALEVRKGEAFTILGPSGEGKTVLLKMLAGLLPPTRGKVLFHGDDLYAQGRKSRARLATRIGMAFQKGGLFDSMSTGDNLRFPLRELLRLSRTDTEARMRKALEDVGLGGQEALEVRELSGGMQKRLGIARALVLEPEVALFDDPTAGLDPITSRAILELIKGLKERSGMTVLVVTSDPRQAYTLTDRIGFLYQGRFLEVGTQDAIRHSEIPVVRQFIEGRLEGPLTSRPGDFA